MVKPSLVDVNLKKQKHRVMLNDPISRCNALVSGGLGPILLSLAGLGPVVLEDNALLVEEEIQPGLEHCFAGGR